MKKKSPTKSNQSGEKAVSEQDTLIVIEDEIYELKDYLPLNCNNRYFEKMFKNLLVIKETDFYNNAVVGLTHFYIYVLHCYLLQLYHADDTHRELLKYLQTTTRCLNSRDNRITVNLDERFDILSFRQKEKESIDYFLHIMKYSKTSQLCQKHQKIIDIRNKAAHLNFEIVDIGEFDTFLKLINENLYELLKKTYKYTKNIATKELKEAIKENRIDEEFYLPIFEEINQINHISLSFYKQSLHYNKFENVVENTPPFYLQKYIKEDLMLENNTINVNEI